VDEPRDNESGQKISGWAWGISLGLHIVLLCALAATTLSRSKAEAQSVVPQANIRATAAMLADAEPVGPKPKIRAGREGRVAEAASGRTWSLKSEEPAERIDAGAPQEAAAVTRTQAGSGTGRTAAIRFFESATRDTKVVFVVDASGSMIEHWRKVQRELESSIEQLDAQYCFAIIMFNKTLTMFEDGKAVRATTAKKKEAIAFIKAMRPGGPTNARVALERAFAVRDETGKKPGTIYFLTDGFDLDEKGAEALSRQIAERRRELAEATKINTIGFYSEEIDVPILESIARESGGTSMIIR
jgi:Mg-chelatase subunit ChlD